MAKQYRQKYTTKAQDVAFMKATLTSALALAPTPDWPRRVQMWRDAANALKNKEVSALVDILAARKFVPKPDIS